jgi:hypothetical protein
MATSTLSDALAGLNFGVGDTGYGIAANSLAAMAPKLINPYGSVGQNLGVGLGSVLLTALLQYQGKKSALEDSLNANTIANDLMAKTTTPEERVAYVQNLANQGTDSDVIGKVSTLATALTQSDKEQAIATEARRQATLQDAYAKFAAEQGVPVEAVPSIWEQRYPTSGATVASDATGKPGFKTKDELAADAAALKEQRNKIREERGRLNSDTQVKEFNTAKAALTTAKDAATRNTEAGKQAVIMLFNRTLNPGNQVTLNEMDQTGRADTIFNKFATSWNALTPNDKGVRISTMTPEALNELLSISQLTVDAMGKQYNEKVTNTVGMLRNLGVSPELATVNNVGPVKLHLSSDESNKKANEIGALKAKAAQVMASGADEASKKAMAQKAMDRIAEIQAELSDFSRD